MQLAQRRAGSGAEVVNAVPERESGTAPQEAWRANIRCFIFWNSRLLCSLRFHPPRSAFERGGVCDAASAEVRFLCASALLGVSLRV